MTGTCKEYDALLADGIRINGSAKFDKVKVVGIVSLQHKNPNTDRIEWLALQTSHRGERGYYKVNKDGGVLNGIVAHYIFSFLSKLMGVAGNTAGNKKRAQA
jgi:hypothetical protein